MKGQKTKNLQLYQKFDILYLFKNVKKVKVLA